MKLKAKKAPKRIVIEIDPDLYEQINLKRIEMKLTWKSMIEQLFEMTLKEI